MRQFFKNLAMLCSGNVFAYANTIYFPVLRFVMQKKVFFWLGVFFVKKTFFVCFLFFSVFFLN